MNQHCLQQYFPTHRLTPRSQRQTLPFGSSAVLRSVFQRAERLEQSIFAALVAKAVNPCLVIELATGGEALHEGNP